MTMDPDVLPTRRPKLADRLVDAVRRKIRDGELLPGSRLPPENQLAKQHGVSRTVVREAITRLAADGLVHARQGAGVFVNEEAPSAIENLFADVQGKLSVVLNVLEVRMAIEMEAAALGALRRTASQDAEIQTAFRNFEELLHQGKPTGAADFAFHRAIAAATNNPFYVEILDVLGRRTIPRDLVTTIASDLLQSQEYQQRLQAEHRAIMDAISAGDPGGAREAMRSHLVAAQQRYHDLLRGGGDFDQIFLRQLA